MPDAYTPAIGDEINRALNGAPGIPSKTARVWLRAQQDEIQRLTDETAFVRGARLFCANVEPLAGTKDPLEQITWLHMLQRRVKDLEQFIRSERDTVAIAFGGEAAKRYDDMLAAAGGEGGEQL